MVEKVPVMVLLVAEVADSGKLGSGKLGSVNPPSALQ